MAKYHINYKGEAGVCQAKAGGCPFGGDEDHFPSKAKAREAFEKVHEAFEASHSRSKKDAPGSADRSRVLFESISTMDDDKRHGAMLYAEANFKPQPDFIANAQKLNEVWHGDIGIPTGFGQPENDVDFLAYTAPNFWTFSTTLERKLKETKWDTRANEDTPYEFERNLVDALQRTTATMPFPELQAKIKETLRAHEWDWDTNKEVELDEAIEDAVTQANFHGVHGEISYMPPRRLSTDSPDPAGLASRALRKSLGEEIGGVDFALHSDGDAIYYGAPAEVGISAEQVSNILSDNPHAQYWTANSTQGEVGQFGTIAGQHVFGFWRNEVE